ncbi:MAG: glycosyltransferase family 39 protein [Actinobacteria bacterium]|nr:glycosyltransferase family 39 protein [Actinomycetota bacterium]
MSAVAYLPRLTTATLLPDEAVYLEAGAALVAGDATANPEHPPLAKLLFGLAQTVVPDPVLAVRLVGVLAGLAIAVALFLLVSRATDRRWGVAAAGVWAILPHALRFPDQPFGGFDKLDRYGMLDPVATALAMLGLVAAMRWWDQRRLPWMLVAGGLLGLAGAAKLSALLLLPVLLLVPVLSPARTPRVLWSCWAVLGAGAVAAFLAAFAPLGVDAPAAVAHVVTLQDVHRSGGHPVVIGGVLHDRAPWWANLAYQWRDDGAVLTVALVLAAAVGATGRRTRDGSRAVLTAAVLVPLAGLALSPVALPHYRFLWLPPLVGLAILGIRDVGRRGLPGRVAATLVAGVLLVAGGASVLHPSTRDAGDYRVVAELVGELDDPRPRVLVVGYPRILAHYVPQAELVRELPADVVVLDPKITARRPVEALEATLRESGTHRRLEVDRLVVWIEDVDP